MSEQQTVATPTEGQPTAPVTETKPQVPVSALPEEALKARLDAAKRTGQEDLLKSLGVTDAGQLKAALETLKAAEDAKKSDAEKLAALLAEKQTNEARLTAYSKAIESVWGTESAKLTAEQSAAVLAIAGDDPAQRLQVLNALRPTWAVAQAPVTPPTPPPAAPPVSTTSAAGAPAPTVVSPTDHTATWQAMRSANPIAAAQYLLAHANEISTGS